jgi:hypothetical protein
MLRTLVAPAALVVGLAFGLGGAPPLEDLPDPFLAEAHAGGKNSIARHVLRQKERVDVQRVHWQEHQISREKRQIAGIKRGLKTLSPKNAKKKK